MAAPRFASMAILALLSSLALCSSTKVHPWPRYQDTLLIEKEMGSPAPSVPPPPPSATPSPGSPPTPPSAHPAPTSPHPHHQEDDTEVAGGSGPCPGCGRAMKASGGGGGGGGSYSGGAPGFGGVPGAGGSGGGWGYGGGSGSDGGCPTVPVPGAPVIPIPGVPGGIPIPGMPVYPAPGVPGYPYPPPLHCIPSTSPCNGKACPGVAVHFAPINLDMDDKSMARLHEATTAGKKGDKKGHEGKRSDAMEPAPE
ncbi:hypothetical protein RJ639_014131 [Escallonia herrerae]|uniref:Uncharacterized protein n=1 Tax=Escallonia herrerae TaxID=1293975 RepID=A0AA89ANT3_9ASTE|nr:hypothetical protein RJ639_014131 [Escallonia herrerae]